jgi:predicted transposase/invertase (TIGR01784 family)
LRISPTNDLALKKVLASEENKDILQGLVHDFFGLTVRCDDIVLDHPYSIKEYRELTVLGEETVALRQTIADVTASLTFANLTAELQVKRDKFFSERSIYYAFDRFCSGYNTLGIDEHIHGSVRFSTLKPLYALNILGFNHFLGDTDALRTFGLYDERRGKRFDKEYLVLAYFELKKDNVETANQGHWKDYFTTGTVASDAPDYIKKASRIIEVVNLDKEEREVVDIMEKALAVSESIKYTAYLDGLEEGEAKGEARGKREGKREVARNLKSKGIPLALVAETTGLSIREIERL